MFTHPLRTVFTLCNEANIKKNPRKDSIQSIHIYIFFMIATFDFLGPWEFEHVFSSSSKLAIITHT